MEYYGKHYTDAQGMENNDAHPVIMVAEGVDFAYKAGVDFSKYDWNDDKEVDQVFVIYAGYAEAQNAAPETIWPHEWTLSAEGKTKKYNGVTINTYGCASELMNNKGEIDAWDIHEHRVKLVKDTAKKLGLGIINATVRDATRPSPVLIKKYDKILLDVPCTGIGVIRKKPDIKWTRSSEDIEMLSTIQAEILNNCSQFLKDGGRLVYSTCTIFKRENNLQIEKFLKDHDDFKLVEEINLYPNVDDTDGFYIAVLER
jgi:hypothetical protein